MLFPRFMIGRDKRREKSKRVDLVAEQVKKLLTEVDQKLILMVRG